MLMTTTSVPTEKGGATMRLIDVNAFIAEYCKNCGGGCDLDDECCSTVGDLEKAPTVDAVTVVHGRWELYVRSYYVDTWDESCELAIYITASCSECGEKHPNNHQVFSKHLYAPEDADDDFRFDRAEEMAKALAEFKQRGYKFANYCPNCGSKMDWKRTIEKGEC